MKVGEGVLIPRPETELLVQLTINNLQCTINEALILDLCAGTGCVGIALAKEIGCNVIAVEKSSEAIEYLKQNVKLNNVESQVEIVKADILEEQLSIVNCQFFIVINPPYLSKSEMQSLQKEVTHEPESALFGGEDGLEFYRRFFERWSEMLNQACLFACEVGDGQARAVSEMLEKIGLSPQIKKDYNGIDRIVYSVKT
jgi:release factor glutamine methyltransferase